MYPQLLLSPVLLVSVEATYRSISEKDGKEELSCQMLSFHWKLDLRLDSCWNFRRLGNDTSNIPPPSMNTIDNTFPEGSEMSLCTLLYLCLLHSVTS
jgi:hypothetical protein